MANILNIDTSSGICSVALATDGEIRMGLESSDKMDHSTTLAPYVDKCIKYLKEQGEKLDAVSVVSGPGSYTGLRIGLSMAKGLAFGFDIPLITLSTLKVMAVRGIFSDADFSGEELIVPMIDARRMEVYTGVYDSSLKLKFPEEAKILDENSFLELKDYPKIIFIGDGAKKFQDIYKGNNGKWLNELMSHAKYMVTLSELAYRKKEFSDIAYSVPQYLKEYQATMPKNKVIEIKK